MRKYKLIKEYPGSPKLGEEIMVHGEVVNYVRINSLCELELLPKYKDLIKSFEFWEEIKEKEEKEYEILSFHNKISGRWYLQELNRYRYEDDIYCKSLKHLDWMLKSNSNYIHSVKRLSDGEIFTIGDKVNTITKINKKSNITIKSFELYGDSTIIVYTNECNGFEGGKYKNGVNLLKIEHSKSSLFITEDGVEMFVGDEYYFIYDNKDIVKFTVKDEHSSSNFNDGNKRFSTKEAAQKWIDENFKIKIGNYEVKFQILPSNGKIILINNFYYTEKDLELFHKVLNNYSSQIKSLNVGCQGQYKVDLDLINKIIARLHSM